MQKIEVFLPSTTDSETLSEQLFVAGAQSVSVIVMRIFNTKQKRMERYRGAECVAQPSSKLKAEIVVDPASLLPVMKVIRECAGENEPDNIRAFISDLEELSTLLASPPAVVM